MQHAGDAEDASPGEGDRKAGPGPAALRVGAAVTGSGPLAAFGQAARQGLLLWHEQYLARAGPTDPTIHLEFVDDEGRPAVAAARFADLAQRVHVAVGPYGSPLTEAILPVCREAGLPVLIASAGDPGLDLGGLPGDPPIGFSLLPPNTESLTAAVDWAASMGVQSVALLFRDDAFSRQAAQGARRRAGELGLKVAWDRTYRSAAEIWQVAIELELAEKDSRASGHSGDDGDRSGGYDGHSGDQASDSRGKVGLLLGGGYTARGEAGGFLPDAREIAIAFEDKAEWKALLVAPTFPEFREALGARAEGILGNTNWKPWFPWPGNAEFASSYRRRWGEEPDNHAAAAYAAGQLIEAAWRRMRPRRERLAAVRFLLRRALAGLETTTVFGPYAVDAGGRQIAHANVLLQWQGGRLEPLNLPSLMQAGAKSPASRKPAALAHRSSHSS